MTKISFKFLKYIQMLKGESDHKLTTKAKKKRMDKFDYNLELYCYMFVSGFI